MFSVEKTNRLPVETCFRAHCVRCVFSFGLDILFDFDGAHLFLDNARSKRTGSALDFKSRPFTSYLGRRSFCCAIKALGSLTRVCFEKALKAGKRLGLFGGKIIVDVFLKKSAHYTTRAIRSCDFFQGAPILR